ncbi:MAG: hypothetical protein ACI9HK_002745, partial [Pirellulaceae bacterium]
NGKIITRTLHGNVATYVTTADGDVLDILPGIYEPQTYVARMQELRTLHQFVSHGDGGTRFNEYHQIQAGKLAAGQPREVFERTGGFTSIRGVETPVEIVLRPAVRIQGRASIANGRQPAGIAENVPTNPADLPSWKALATDTEINESQRRQKIHSYLAKQGLVKPEHVTKWLYREVLHADLDDPYLGLGKLLFDSYPFDDG